MEILLEHDAGYVRADKAIAAFIRHAKKHGAQIHERKRISTWRKKSDKLLLEVNGERHVFDRLIIAPGAFASSLLGDIGAPVKPMRKTLFWTAPGDDRFHCTHGFLPFAIQQSDGRFYYGFPAVDDDGVKVGEHTGGTTVASPSDDPAEARKQDRKDVTAFLKRHAPGLPSEFSKEQSCLYEMSPDSHFIIDKHPADERVSFAIGLSGHGFKFAPAIGEALADLALNGEARPDFDFLKFSRFSG
jgi:glycine/D-amino acid oxidase-like deaminating enzyme